MTHKIFLNVRTDINHSIKSNGGIEWSLGLNSMHKLLDHTRHPRASEVCT